MLYAICMVARLNALILLPVLVAGLLVPKVSALALHLNPNVMTIVICSGTDLLTIHIDAEGQPIEVTEAGQADCVVADPDDVGARAYLGWTLAPRSYRADFVDTSCGCRTVAEVGLLPDLRGPPGVI